MADNDPIIVPLAIDLNQALKDLAALVSAGAKAEDALESLLKTASKIGDKLDKLSGPITITVNASAPDLNQIVKKVDALDGESADIAVTVSDQGLQGVIGAVESLDSISPDIDVTVSTDGKLEQAAADATALDSISPSIAINVQDNELTDASGKVEKLDSAAPSIPVNVQDSELTDAQGKIEKIDSSAPSVVIRTTEQLDEVINKLNSIEKLSTIQLVITATGVIEKLDEIALAIPGAGTILEMNEAMRTFEAQTGKSGKVYEDAIGGVFEQNWGESQGEVAEVAAKLTQAGVAAEDLKVATTAVFESMSVTGYDAEKTVDAQVKLVKNGLVPGYQEASDLIVSGFQQGGDAAGDFLDTITEYSSHFNALKIDGPTALNLIVQSLQAGTRDSDKLADSFKELNLKLQEAVGTKAGPTFDALTKLGLFDEAQATVDGSMSGTAFATAAIEAAKTKGTDFDLVEIFGTPLEDFGVDIFKNLDFTAASESLIPTGTATDAAATLSDTWASSVEALKRTIETDLADSFKIAGQPLSDILDGAKEKIQEITALLQSGKSIPEALEIVLQAPGLTAEIQRLEASIGDFILTLMGFAADVQEALHIGDQGVNLRKQVAKGAEQQFAFDIKVANPDEVTDVVQRAIDRGVKPEDISKAFTTATDELISQGDVDRAQELLYAVNEMPTAFIKASQSGGKGVVDLPFKVDPNASAQEIQAAIDAAVLTYEQDTGNNIVGTFGDVKFTPTIDTTAAHTAIDETLTMIDAGLQNLQKPIDIITAPFKAVQQSILDSPLKQFEIMDAGAQSIQVAQERQDAAKENAQNTLAIISQQTGNLVNTITAAATGVGGALNALPTANLPFKAEDIKGAAVQGLTDAYVELQTSIGTVKLPFQFDPVDENPLLMSNDITQDYAKANPGVEITSAWLEITDASEEMKSQAVSDFTSISTSAADLLGGKVVQSASDANLEFARVVVGTDDLMTNGGARLDAFAANGVEKAGTLANAWSAVAGAIASTGAAIPTVPGSTTATPYGPALPPTDTSTLAHGATGGQFPGGVPMIVGEQGEELWVPPSDGTLIDHDTTSLIMQALDLVKGAGGAVVNNSSTTNYNMGGLNNNFNVPNQAAGVSASSTIARQIRSLRS